MPMKASLSTPGVVTPFDPLRLKPMRCPQLFNLVPLGRKDQGFADDVSGLPAPFFGFGDLACRFRGMGYTLQVQGSVWLGWRG